MVVSAPSPGKCVQNLEPIDVRGGPTARVSLKSLESVIYMQNLAFKGVNRWGVTFSHELQLRSNAMAAPEIKAKPITSHST